MSDKKNEIVVTTQTVITSDRFKEQIGEALPNPSTLDRFMRALFTSVQKTPKLLNCSIDSVRAAGITCAEMGVIPNGRDAHLVPFGNVCTLIIDYKGLVKLALESGLISYIHADVICDKDVFEYNMGQIIKHEINFREPRGEPYAVYAVAVFKDGSKKYEVMTAEDVNGIRKRSKAANDGPWVTDTFEMWKKTVLRRLTKMLPLTPKIHDHLQAEDSQGFKDAKPVTEMSTPDFMEAETAPIEDVTPEEEDTSVADQAEFVKQAAADMKKEAAAEKARKSAETKAKNKAAAEAKAAEEAAKVVEPVEETIETIEAEIVEASGGTFAGVPVDELSGALKKLHTRCTEDEVTEAQVAEFCSSRGRDINDTADQELLVGSWDKLADDIKAIEV